MKPALDVKRKRFQVETASDWAEIEKLVSTLIPYAREFDHAVKVEVLDVTSSVIDRVMKASMRGRPVGGLGSVLRTVDSVLMLVMPIPWGGAHKASGPLPNSDRELFVSIEAQVFALSWDACRYVRDIEALKIGAGLYWYLIRFAALNEIEGLLASWLENIDRCKVTCRELKEGKDFAEGERYLAQMVRDALENSRK